jgi:hypothetical protein
MKGICFTKKHIDYIISGRKSQTRRKLPNNYKVGELLYARESFYLPLQYDNLTAKEFISIMQEKGLAESEIIEFVSYEKTVTYGRKRNSRFMPMIFSRAVILVEHIKNEHVQEIDIFNCICEGILLLSSNELPHKATTVKDYRNAYKAIFDSLNGEGSYDENPFVSAISFVFQK